MTMGPGAAVWERFGHNAIWIDDPVGRPRHQPTTTACSTSSRRTFSSGSPRGRCGTGWRAIPAEPYVRSYVRANRSVWLQELNLPPKAQLELREFLRWNERPENRFYHYDYYDDNCSTRVRDAIDRVIGGAIKSATDSLPTGTSYRFHTQRLTANDPPIFTALLLALGEGVDRPISAWEEMFLPLGAAGTHQASDGAGTGRRAGSAGHRRAHAVRIDRAASAWQATVMARLVCLRSASLIGLGVAGARCPRASDWSRAGSVWGRRRVVWGLVGGLAGTVLAGLWGLTDHAMAYHNENLLQLNPLVLGLVLLAPLAVGGSARRARWASRLALASRCSLCVGLVVQVLPGFDQVNGPVDRPRSADPPRLRVRIAGHRLRLTRRSLASQLQLHALRCGLHLQAVAFSRRELPGVVQQPVERVVVVLRLVVEQDQPAAPGLSRQRDRLPWESSGPSRRGPG